MPQLINALPLVQQLSNKQDISVGLLSVFCVTEGEGVCGGLLNIQSLLDGILSTWLAVSCGVFSFFEMQIFPFPSLLCTNWFKGIHGKELELLSSKFCLISRNVKCVNLNLTSALNQCRLCYMNAHAVWVPFVTYCCICCGVHVSIQNSVLSHLNK